MIKIPNWIKLTLWLVLIAFFSWLLSQRYNAIINGSSNATDIIIFLIWIALIAAFIFQEVNIFGVGFKKESDTPRPSPDSKLPEIRKVAKATLKEESIELPAESQPTLEKAIPGDISYLFAVRYNIESELKRITDIYCLSNNMKFYPKTVIQKLEFLVHMKAIHRNLAFILKEMFSYCSAGIHGEEVSVNAMTWIRQDAPGIIEALKAIPEEAEADKE